MDRIGFERVKENSSGYDDTGVRILVNGTDVKEIVEAAGNELNYNYQEANRLYDYLMYGECFQEYGAACICTCTGGTDERGGAWCRIEETADEVIWRDFHHVGIAPWAQLEKLHFNKAEYQQELEKLKDF